jgi:hypothetical protein
MAKQPTYQGLKEALKEGTKSPRKWYGRVDNTSPVYFICLGMFSCSVTFWLWANLTMLVLDPNIKDLYYRHEWDSEHYTAGMKQLEDVVGRTSLYFVFGTLFHLVAGGTR